MPHTYRAYGLEIASEIECPELRPAPASAPDVTVRFGPVAAEETEIVIARADGPDAFLIAVPGVARYRIHAGREICIDPAPGVDEGALRLFLLGSAFGALLHQRGVTPIHGSAVAMGDGAVIFSGPQGHGKSTLAAAFARLGHTLLSDDVCPVTVEDEAVWLHPAYPRLSLLPDAVAHLAVSLAPEDPRQPYSGKHLVPVSSFGGERRRLAALYELLPAPVDEVRLHPLTGFECIKALMGNTYRVQFVREMGHAARHFAALQEIARRVRVVRVERPAEGYLLDELVAAIADDCRLRNL